MCIRDSPNSPSESNINSVAVSYTHLDVYKRQPVSHRYTIVRRIIQSMLCMFYNILNGTNPVSKFFVCQNDSVSEVRSFQCLPDREYFLYCPEEWKHMKGAFYTNNKGYKIFV